MPLFKCTCGELFTTRERRFTHIALANPRWPRIARSDPHAPAEGRLKASEAIANIDWWKYNKELQTKIKLDPTTPTTLESLGFKLWRRRLRRAGRQ